MNIFILKTFSLEDEMNLEVEVPSFPLRMYSSNMWLGFNQYFSSKAKAILNVLENYNHLEKQDKHSIIYFTIEEQELDTGKWVATEYYSPDGKLMMKSSDGDDEEAVLSKKYKKFDYVMFLYNHSLCVGQVLEVPEIGKAGDNTYYISYYDPHNPKDTHPHSHGAEGSIIKKIENEDIAKYFSTEALVHLATRIK